jgi:hypothetical protein
MDLFAGDELYARAFSFRETEPLNPKFDQFGMGDLNFFNNSGSLLIM